MKRDKNKIKKLGDDPEPFELQDDSLRAQAEYQRKHSKNRRRRKQKK